MQLTIIKNLPEGVQYLQEAQATTIIISTTTDKQYIIREHEGKLLIDTKERN